MAKELLELETLTRLSQSEKGAKQGKMHVEMKSCKTPEIVPKFKRARSYYN